MRKRESHPEAEGMDKQSQGCKVNIYLVSNRILNHVKAIVMLSHIQGRLLHGLGLVITFGL